MPPVAPVTVMLPLHAVERILFLARDNQAAASAPDPKRLPGLQENVVTALMRRELRHGKGEAKYEITLKRDDTTVLRDWLREVAPRVSEADRKLFLAAADAISVETLK
jgi:hypothetical protein